ncbi:FecR domain-containing protein [Pseudomonas sp. ABC1]|uniref:FecR family protein n=1 Tax=Pseudomonas sp. ABC1 TaxID=2748080 RepID=UPI0015C3BA84|nr:FecR domain-containing protein [Pseudomonas sp. ABC1]QLF92754.1 FecR domain-containing protein [Pseudomonas sp. ABC1]
MSDERILLQAAEWAMRQNMESLDEQDFHALEQWLQIDPRHADALAEAERVWAMTAELPPLPPLRVARTLPAVPAAPVRPRRPRRQARWGAAAASILAVCLGFFATEELPPLLADYRTATGETRVVQLDDGSRIHLGSHAALDVAYDREIRRVKLLRGEALFEPAPVNAGEPRPFIVENAGGRSEALGTRFLVRDEGSAGTWVGILEHRVAVSLDQQRIELEQGQTVRYSSAFGIRRLDENPERAADWSRGVLEFRQEPLAHALERIGTFRPGLLKLLDSEQADTPVSGLLHLDNLDDGLDRMAAQHGLKVVRLPGIALLVK